jgi:uncharacterized protein (UPF0548 family)
MAEWRFGRGWTPEELADRLERIGNRPTNFTAEYASMTPENGWNRYHSEALIAREPPGPPLQDGPFRRAEIAVANYHLSDPEIVIGHFPAGSRLLGRRILLEIKVMGLHYLAAVLVGAVRFEGKDGCHTFAFRYDTLDGHIEKGSEWFLLTKDEETGEIRFRIEAAWQPGQFPNWWSRVGFRFVGLHYQRRWHREAHRRLFRIAHDGMPASPVIDRLGVAHAGPVVVFERTPAHPTIPKPQWDENETRKSS